MSFVTRDFHSIVTHNAQCKAAGVPNYHHAVGIVFEATIREIKNNPALDDCKSLCDVHDIVDGNELSGLCDNNHFIWSAPYYDCFDESLNDWAMYVINTSQDMVNRWLEGGRLPRVRTCIRNLPNSPRIHALIPTLKHPYVHARKRGRGARATPPSNGRYRCGSEHQDLPLYKAARFSYYQNSAKAVSSFNSYQQFDYVGIDDKTGKLRIRAGA